MPPDNKTLYDALGVPRNAKNTDIGLAYNRFKAAMQKEDSIPDSRRAAMAKVAFETLSDLDRRAEYDASLDREGSGARSGGRKIAAISAVAILAVAGAGYYFFEVRSAARPEEKVFTSQELLEAVSPRLGSLQSALVSGEVRDLGVAVATSQDQMVTTCRGFTAGAQLSVKSGGFTMKADLTRANEELDVCVLAVKDAGAGITVRLGLPAPHEKVRAVVLDAKGAAQVRHGNVTRLIDDPKGSIIDLKMPVPLPNGTPIFDSQARLVGIVTTPHAFGEGLVVALGAPRITQALAHSK